MVLVAIATDDGREVACEVARHDLVAEVKARAIQRHFPKLKGLMVALIHRGKEMPDEASIGDFQVRSLSGIKFNLSPYPKQPYGSMDYAKIAAALEREGHKKSAASFFKPGDEWSGQWTKGDEYKEYPPVDVDNKWSTVPPSTSRELAFSPSSKNANGFRHPETNGLYCEIPERIRQKRAERERRASVVEEKSRAREQEEKERQFRRARQRSFGSEMESPTNDAAATGPPTRGFQSVYTCIVRGCRFELIHKMEGHWSGEAIFTNASCAIAKRHASSSRIGFLTARQSWAELQQITSESGVSSTQQFYYLPQADGLALVDAENSSETFLRDTLIKLQEINSNVLLMTATNIHTGLPVLTETTTFTEDFHARVRSGQRFDSVGAFKASYTIKERKFVDQDTGAIERVDKVHPFD